MPGLPEPPRHVLRDEPDDLLFAHFVVATIALALPAGYLLGAGGIMLAVAFTAACMVIVGWRRRRYALIMPMAPASIFAGLVGVAVMAAASR